MSNTPTARARAAKGRRYERRTYVPGSAKPLRPMSLPPMTEDEQNGRAKDLFLGIARGTLGAAVEETRKAGFLPPDITLVLLEEVVRQVRKACPRCSGTGWQLHWSKAELDTAEGPVRRPCPCAQRALHDAAVTMT